MDFDEYLLSGLKQFLRKTVQKNSGIFNGNTQNGVKSPGVYSFEHCRNENFLENLHRMYVNTCGGNKTLDGFKEDISKMLTSAEDRLEALPNLLYTKACTKLILDTNRGTILPLLYEPLLIIFYHTTPHFRQLYFHEILSSYYENLQEESSDFSLEMIEKLVKLLIPLAKLDVLFISFENSKNSTSCTSANSLISELNEVILFPVLLREDCYKILEDKLGDKNYKLVEFKVIPFSERLGMLGDYFRLLIKVEYEKNTKVFQMFAKYLTTSNQTLREISIMGFNKEAFIYRDFIPKLRELGLDKVADFAPKCHFIRTGDVIILDDISVLNYKSWDISSPAGYDFLSIAVKKLAQFHSCSLLLEEKSKRRIEKEYEEYLEEVLGSKEGTTGELERCCVNSAIDYFSKKFPYLSEDLELSKQMVREAFELMYDQIGMSNKYRNVISHGDAHGGNFLFKEVDGKPESCYLIDFQLIRFCPAPVDLFFFLYMTTNREIRKKYKRKLMEDYYEELVRIFESNKIDLKDIYSKEIFFECCDEYEATAICQAICYKQIICLPKNTLNKINNDEEYSKDFYHGDRTETFDQVLEDETFKELMRDILEDLYDVFRTRTENSYL